MDLACAGACHYYIFLENLTFKNVDDQLLVVVLETARQRPHLSSSFIIRHLHIFFSIL
jgi:hypothetical protein